MKYILAPDSFKGSLTAKQAAAAMRAGILEVDQAAEVIALPIADGGEGTIEVLSSVMPGEMVSLNVPGPYGESVNAKYFLSEEHVAYIELAEASGLTLVEENERNPMVASTYGTGLLIKDALLRGVKALYLTLGGSATNDGGAGIAKALGIQYLNQAGEEVAPTPMGLKEISKIDIAKQIAELQQVKIHIVCDVNNPLIGKNGASYVYGPQKGATPKMIEELDEILASYGALLEQETGKDLIEIPGAGAAGGAAMPLLAFADADMLSGIDMVLTAVGFDAALLGADYVFTGEGKIDAQTAYGKAISGIHNRAQKHDVPVLVFTGKLALEEKKGEGIAYYEIGKPNASLEENMKNAYENLKEKVKAVLEGENA